MMIYAEMFGLMAPSMEKGEGDGGQYENSKVKKCFFNILIETSS